MYLIFCCLAIEILSDILEFREKGRVNHKRGMVLRMITLLVIVLLPTMPFSLVFVMAGAYLLVFDHAMGYLITGDMMHMGTEAWWDQAIGRIPGLPRLFLRIFIAGTLFSFHFFPEQWIELGEEIKLLF